MRVSDFHFDLPEELIAQHPPAERGASRMLVVERQGPGNREQGWLRDAMFRDLPQFLKAGDLLVLNDSRVLPARLFGRRRGWSGVVEVLLVEEVADPTHRDDAAMNGAPVWRALVRPGKKVRVGERLEFWGRGAASEGPGLKPDSFGADSHGLKPAAYPEVAGGAMPLLAAEVVGAGEFGERTLRFDAVEDFVGVVGRIGHMPLPPYIRREQGGRSGAEEGMGWENGPQGLKPASSGGADGTAEAVPLTRPDSGLRSGADALGDQPVVDADEAEDRERYQTVYARETGSAAAPTAGLHFTAEVLEELRGRGVEVAYVTLHVGLGTFQPVRVERLEDIKLHSERYTLPAETAEALNRAMAEGRRVVAVGTTTTRVLEHVATEMTRGTTGVGERLEGSSQTKDKKQTSPTESVTSEAKAGLFREGLKGTAEAVPLSETTFSGPLEAVPSMRTRFEAHSGETSIFIGPGHRFRVVGGLLTNFHLPESTLLMLVSALAGRERVLAAYAHAVREGYRFYSYGDCMLVTS